LKKCSSKKARTYIWGKLDEEQWEENGQKFSRFVIIAEDIEYASSDTGKSNGNGTNGANSAPPAQNGNGTAPQQNTTGTQPENPSGFTGFENYGDDNIFY
jgi:single-stranded DNA-binding protein